MAAEAQVLLGRLLALSKEGIAALERGDPELLLGILAEREAFMPRIEPVLRELADARARGALAKPEHGRAMAAIIAPLEALLHQAQAADARLVERLSADRERIDRELEQLGHAEAVTTAYHQSKAPGKRTLNVVR